MNLPWPKPISIYDDDGPREAIEFDLNGRRYAVAPTKEFGVNTMRTRFKVDCLTCGRTLHRATTGTSLYIADHERTVHGGT